MRTMYFNNAGAGIMSEATYTAVVSHMRLEMEVGAYTAANMQSDKVNEFYSNAAKLINATSKEEIAFIDSASRGWNLVMYGLNITENDTIVTIESEYGTNLLTIHDIAKNTGCSVKIVKCNQDSSVDISGIEKAMQEGGTILAISHVAAQGAIVNPVVKLGEIANKYNAIYTYISNCIKSKICSEIRFNISKEECIAITFINLNNHCDNFILIYSNIL